MQWRAAALPVLRELAEQPGTGVRLRRGRERHPHAVEDPPWRPLVDDAGHLDADTLPAPDPQEAQRILRDCAVLQPRLRHARVISHVVALRPARTEVRLELDGHVLHCYGGAE